jgi:hypothetical protein
MFRARWRGTHSKRVWHALPPGATQRFQVVSFQSLCRVPQMSFSGKMSKVDVSSKVDGELSKVDGSSPLAWIVFFFFFFIISLKSLKH